MPLLAILGLVLALLGVLGLIHVVALTTVVSVVLLCAGVVLLILDPGIRSRF